MKEKRYKSVEIELTKEEFDAILREKFDIEGDIHYRLIEGGDYDRGDYHIKGISIWND